MRPGHRPVCTIPGLILTLILAPISSTPMAHAAGIESAGESTSGSGDESEASNESRLRSMPREERLALLEKLKSFDALSRTEQSSIRTLDARIAELSPADQANYWSVLRRYHHWLQGLTDAQRNELDAAPPAERMRLVTRLRAEERTAASTNATPLFVQILDFTAMPPIESAHRLKVWFELTPQARAEIEKLPSLGERQKRLAELGQHVKGTPQQHRFLKSEEDALLAKVETNPQVKSWMSNSLKKSDTPKQDKLRRRLATNFFFLENPAAAVDPGHMIRFESALPTWYREQFDHLPPEEARRRLTILYRLVFPAPGEMPEPARPQSPPRAAS